MKRLLIIVSVFMLIVQITACLAAASEGFEDLVKLVKSGVSEKTLALYIDTSPISYALTVDEILYLNDLGVSTEMITRVNEHGKKMAGGTVESPATPQEAILAAEENPAVSLPPPSSAVQEEVVSAPVVEAQPPDAVDISSFYGALAPYGTWVNIDGTWYWQPAAMVMDRTWAPYCHRGHWVYTDCGWMWQSDYSWGWAPFHYGRWHRHARYGWIWMPDNVWGPAWVSWRYSDTAIGWAPLPPGAMYEVGNGFSFHGSRVSVDFEFGLDSECFTFVQVSQFCDFEPWRVRLHREEVHRFYNNTTIIQNNYIYNNNRIINNGPSLKRIEEERHERVKQVRIVDQDVRPGQPIHAGGINAESVAVYRPHVAPVAHETPQAVVARQQAVQVRHDAVRKVPVLETYKSGAVVQAEQSVGRASVTTTHVAVTPSTIMSKPFISPGNNQRQAEEAAARLRQEEQQKIAAEARRQAEETATRQRQAEEAASRQREDLKRRTDALVRQQEEQRQAEALDRQRQVELQRAALARQQAEEAAARQQEQRRQAEAADRQRQEDQRRALQAQRQAEEAVARQREQQADQQRAVQVQQQAQQGALQDYGNNGMTHTDSDRGSTSRGGSRDQRNR